MQEADKSVGPDKSKATKFSDLSSKDCLQGCKDDETCLNVSYVVLYHPLQFAMDAIPGRPAIPGKEATKDSPAIPEIPAVPETPAKPEVPAWTEKICTYFKEAALAGSPLETGNCYTRRAGVEGKPAAPIKPPT